MKFRTVLVAGASLLAMTAHASAEPITFIIGSALTSLAVASPTVFSVMAVIFPAGASAATMGSAVLSAAMMAASVAGSFMRPKVPTQKIKNTVQGSEAEGRTAFGRVEIESVINYGNTAGYFISRLGLHCFGELDAVEQYFYDDREITVEANGYVSTPPWARPPAHVRPSYMNVQTKIGDGAETAWPSLMSDFPSAWTADHRVRGIVQSLMRIESPGTSSNRFARLLQGGVKSLGARARITKPYDPRTATSQWTMNGALLVRRYMLQLGGLDADEFDDVVASVAADDSDEIVPTLSGSAPRVQLSGGWEGALSADIVGDMMESAGVEDVTTDDGKTSIRIIEDWPDAEISLSKRHIIDNYPQAGPESGKRPNFCRLFYFSPERRYARSEIDLTGIGWARAQNEIDAYGEQEMVIDLTYCCDASQAQRIARRLFLMARADTGIVKTNWAGMACWGKRTAMLEISDVGDEGASLWVKARLGSVRADDTEGTCEIPYVIIPDALAIPFNPETDEAPPPPLLLPQQNEADLEKPGTPSGATLIEYPTGALPGGGGFELRCRYVRPTGTAYTPEVVYRLFSGGAAQAPQSMNEVESSPNGSGYNFSWSATANLTGQKVDFRTRIFNADGDSSFFSDALVFDPAGFNNSATSSPTQSVSGSNGAWVIDVAAPMDLQIAYIQFETNGAVVSTVPARPGGTLTRNDSTGVGPGQSVTFRSRAFTSNGTPSPYSATFSYTEPL